jgi:hypothetical protein
VVTQWKQTQDLFRMKKIVLISFFSLIALLTIAQINDDLDFKFVTPKSSKDRKIHFYTQTAINLTTILGSDARQYRKDIEDYRQSINIDRYSITMYPGVHFGLFPHFKLSEHFSIYTGAQYHLYGWKEIARDRLNSSNYFRYNLNHNFHYISIPLGYALKTNGAVTFRMDFHPMFLVGNSAVLRETIVIGGIKEKEKSKEDFETLYDVESYKFMAMTRLGIDVKIFEKTFVSFGTSITSSMIKEVDFKFVGCYAGITLKL